MPRYTFLVELYGLTQNQRNQATNIVNNALDLEAVSDIVVREVITDYPGKFGDTAFFVNAEFATTESGQRIFDAAYNWANSRATTSPGGMASRVNLVAVDEIAGTHTTWASTSPDWPVATPVVVPLWSLAPPE